MKKIIPLLLLVSLFANAKLAQAKISAQLALTHKLFQLTEFVTTALILVIPAEPLLLFVPHVLRDSTLLDLPVLLLAQLELTPSMEFVNVDLDFSIITVVCKHVLLVIQQLVKIVYRVIHPVFNVVKKWLIVHPAKQVTILTQQQIFVKSQQQHVLMVNIIKVVIAIEAVHRIHFIKEDFVFIHAHQDIKIMVMEVVLLLTVILQTIQIQQLVAQTISTIIVVNVLINVLQKNIRIQNGNP